MRLCDGRGMSTRDLCWRACEAYHAVLAEAVSATLTAQLKAQRIELLGKENALAVERELTAKLRAQVDKPRMHSDECDQHLIEVEELLTAEREYAGKLRADLNRAYDVNAKIRLEAAEIKREAEEDTALLHSARDTKSRMERAESLLHQLREALGEHGNVLSAAVRWQKDYEKPPFGPWYLADTIAKMQAALGGSPVTADAESRAPARWENQDGGSKNDFGALRKEFADRLKTTPDPIDALTKRVDSLSVEVRELDALVKRLGEQP